MILLTGPTAVGSATPTAFRPIAADPIRDGRARRGFATSRRRTDTVAVRQSTLLGFELWFAFHFVGMAGADIWDNMPVPLALVHGGDWPMKMLFMPGVLGAWQGRQTLAQASKER